MCIEAATEDHDAIEAWRRQRRTLERLPSHLANILLHHLLRRRLLFPSLLEVFKHCVDEVNMKGNGSVDAEWMAYIGGFSYLHTLDLSHCRKITSSSIWPITGMPNLKELDLSYCSKITDSGIKNLLSIPTLEKLRIARTNTTSEGVSLLSSLPNLTVLDLGGLPVTDSVLSSLQTLTKLQSLVLWGTSVSDKGASLLRSFRKLTSLDLAWTKVTTLPFLPTLAYLNMSNCAVDSLLESRLERLILSGSRFTNLGFLRGMIGIKKLNLSGCDIGDDSVEFIISIGPSLRHVNLSKTKVRSDGVGRLAGHVPNLETLKLCYTDIDDNALAYINTMHLLKFISLRGTKVKSLAAFHSLHHLERLDLEETLIRDEALSSLPNFDKLKYLSLRGGHLSDACLRSLSKVKGLVKLGVRDAVLTNAGLDFFVPPPGLAVLDLNGCWLVTEDAVRSFCRRYRWIDVRHECVEHDDEKEDKLPAGRVRKESFIDQRLKYSREELLALRSESVSSSSSSINGS